MSIVPRLLKAQGLDVWPVGCAWRFQTPNATSQPTYRNNADAYRGVRGVRNWREFCQHYTSRAVVDRVRLVVPNVWTSILFGFLRKLVILIINDYRVIICDPIEIFIRKVFLIIRVTVFVKIRDYRISIFAVIENILLKLISIRS